MLPMIFMDDVIRATMQLMEAPKESITVRTSYNIAGVSFSPEEVVDEIRELYPDFKVKYQPDFRQDIASRWPRSIDDSLAANDWGWKPKFDLKDITQTMIQKLKETYKKSS